MKDKNFLKNVKRFGLVFTILVLIPGFVVLRFFKNSKNSYFPSEDSVPVDVNLENDSDFPDNDDEVIELDDSEPTYLAEKDLSKRQAEILKFIRSNTDVDTTILNAKFKDVTVRTLRRDLKTLTDLDLVDKVGETKGVFYKAK